MTSDYHYIKLKRVYDPVAEDDGIRLLADRLWPRGIKKADLACDQWIKAVCPSTTLRKQWHQGEMGFETFTRLYTQELQQYQPQLQQLCESYQNSNITLLSSVKDIQHSHLPVLRDALNETMEKCLQFQAKTRSSPVCYQQDKIHKSD